MAHSNRVLIKLRPDAVPAVANLRANLRPLHDTGEPYAGRGIASAPGWYLADVPDGGPGPWDAAHSRVSDQLGIDESAILFAEPDLPQKYPSLNERNVGGGPFPVDSGCLPVDQEDSYGRVKGPGFAWHLGDAYSQLASAREAVEFTDPRTRIAHIDTGYDKTHMAQPMDARILHSLECNFVDGDDQPQSAQDPNRRHLFDNSGHGTGTIGILAGGRVPELADQYLGGAPHADILPLRIANSVVLFYTSAFAEALQYAVSQRCDVVSISMGGLPSRAWNEAVNNAYEAGICIVAASGDCFGGLPTSHVVYPARYRRTLAACGVMADGMPYYDLPPDVVEGNWGPDSCMTCALSSYTPNIPWAMFGCKTAIRRNGQGTSAATPQIAAAVALWYENYKGVLPRDWRRVEAVRNALFQSAKAGDPQRLGHGILQAKAALAVSPVLNLPKTPPDEDSFPFFRVITGLGVADKPAREEMFNLELTQRWLMNGELRKIAPEPGSTASLDVVRQFMEAAIEDGEASLALRRHIANRYASVFGASARNVPADVALPPRPACNPNVVVPDPPFRRIRTYAIDPSFSTRLDTASINETVLNVRWEKLKPGPVGEYLEVKDTDATGAAYAPVDLDDPRLLARDGHVASEGNPAFHQQMVYAVVMTTIAHFERALGRPVLWRPGVDPANESDDSRFERRLRVSPHALHEANAYYSPQEIALRFGYFEASANDPGDHVPGSTVYTCLSHDIVAHETTHAILDGMHRRFNEASNPDVLAFHEGFADIVSLMQHFTIGEVLENEIGRTRGDLEAESVLGSLAVQFGRATGGRGALRDAIGKVDEKGAWTRIAPNPEDYRTQLTPHARGAILIAAVFDAFLAIYRSRTADLLRIYTGGTGVLPAGAIHPDLVRRMANEASKSARHILNICIRALDYVPPVDLTFGEYLRGLITADADLVEDDRFDYRVAFVEAFRRRGIYPPDLDVLSVDTLRWRGVDLTEPPPHYRTVLERLKHYADVCFYLNDRRDLFEETRRQRRALHGVLKEVFRESPDFATVLGLDAKLDFEVHALRRCMRIGPDGRHLPQVVVALTQSSAVKVAETAEPLPFRGGSTLIVDLAKPAVQYKITKSINSEARRQRTEAFLRDALQDPLRALLLTPNRREPFAMLHSLADVGGF